MEIKKNIDGTTLNVALEGHLDTMTSKDLDAAIKDDIAKAKDAIFDLKDVDYLSSAGLRLLLSYSKALGGKEHVIVRHSNGVLQEIFRVTAFQNFVTLEQ